MKKKSLLASVQMCDETEERVRFVNRKSVLEAQQEWGRNLDDFRKDSIRRSRNRRTRRQINSDDGNLLVEMKIIYIANGDSSLS